jgi:putative phosphoserine phosphatase/1-acylglycerol-3-phosphate O-acyltransferase
MWDGRPAHVGAFFDVDKTVLAENSGTLFLRALYERGEIDWKTLLSNLGSYVQYKLNLLDIERWTKRTMTQFRGRSERELVEEAVEWFEQYVQPTIYPEAREVVRWHNEEGHVVALVSGGTKFVVGPVAEHLGISHMMYTHLEVSDGVFTGRVLDPICFGEGKVYWLQQFVEQEHVDLARSYFYTDSITDLPLLELVGHPQVVNPDPLIYREAVRRRWPVRFFRDPRERRKSEPEAPSDDPGAP